MTTILIIALFITLLLLSVGQEDTAVDGRQAPDLHCLSDRTNSIASADEGETTAVPHEQISTSGRERAAA